MRNKKLKQIEFNVPKLTMDLLINFYLEISVP